MNNPILLNYRSRMLYAGAWVLITAIQALVVYWKGGLSPGDAFADSFVFNTLLAALLISTWYPVYYNRVHKGYYRWLIHSVLAGLLLLPLWLGFGCTGMYFLFGDDKSYLSFMVDSIWWKTLEGLLAYLLLVLIFYVCMYVYWLNEKRDNEIRLNKLIRDSELNVLRSQINPHFLFNSLNSLNALILKDPPKASEMLVALSDYLRYTVLSTRQETFEVREEVENIVRYLTIEKLRFGNKLNYDFDVQEDTLKEQMPSMLLQPLFENALKHGVYESTDSVTITTQIKKERNDLFVVLSNDFDPSNASRRKGSGTGLKNISERLRLTYGGDASLQTRTEDGKFTVVVRIPAIKK